MKRKIHKQEPTLPVAEQGLLPLAFIHVDALLERIRYRKLKAFDPSLIEQLGKLSSAQLKTLNHQYKRTLEDFKAAIAGDEDFVEAYSCYDKNSLKVAYQLLKSLKSLKHDDTTAGRRFVGGTKRKTKTKTPEQIVQKVLYLEKDPETGLSSLKPQELVGAGTLWVYNTKTRKLGFYHALNEKGLSAKGTTILNYDEKLSCTKTIRKPKTQLVEFLSKTPVEMRKYWERIKAVPQAISPRLHRETLILRAA